MTANLVASGKDVQRWLEADAHHNEEDGIMTAVTVLVVAISESPIVF